MKKLLRTRATNRDADLIVVTDEGHTLDDDLTMDEATAVIAMLANKVRAFYAAAEDRLCEHELDAMGSEEDVDDLREQRDALHRVYSVAHAMTLKGKGKPAGYRLAELESAVLNATDELPYELKL